MFKPKAWWEIYEVLANEMSQEQAMETANDIYNRLARAGFIKKIATKRVQ